MEKWFRSFSEVPGIKYRGGSSIYRPQLPEHMTVPAPRFYELTGMQSSYLSWPKINGSGNTSASPAQQWIIQPHPAREGETTAQARLRQLYESLELPGSVSDYHLAIQGCCSALLGWQLRREEPWVLAEIEQLCWLDIQLLQAYATLFQVKNDQGFQPITTLQILLSLFEQEGYLAEALSVAEIAVRFKQQLAVSAFERIKSRLVNLETEGAS